MINLNTNNVPRGLSFLVFLIFCCTSCKKESTFLPAKTIMDESYGSHQRQKMDVYLPSNRNQTDTKVLVWIHGGAWIEGDKSEFENIKTLLDDTFTDYAFISLNYRLFDAASGANKFPAQENDIQSAISYIKSNLSSWELSDKVVIAGGSAGGHLALLQAYKHNADNFIKACVAYFPPTELVSFFPANLLSILVLSGALGGNPDQQPTLYAESSPLNFISDQSVPTLFFHGTADNVVPISQSYLLEEKLQENNVLFDFIYFEGEAHAFSNSNVNLSILRMGDFLNQHNP